MSISEQEFNPGWPMPDEEVRQAFLDMQADGSWGRYHGPHCERLRAALAVHHGVSHCLLTCSGTSAVELALRGCRVSPGDEVVLSAYDFKANFINVLTTGATPVLVDVLPDSPVIDVSGLAAAVTEKTRAILVSHLHGFHAPMEDLCRRFQGSGIALIEDACQNPGALVDGRPSGSWADVGVLSFGGSKLLTAGRGGAVLTSRPEIVQRIRLHVERGNEAYPLSEMQAAVLLPQLRCLDALNEKRRHSVEHIGSQFSPDDLLRPLNRTADCAGSGERHLSAWYKVPFLLDSSVAESQKAELTLAFQKESIPLSPGFSALHEIHAHSRFRACGELRHAQAFSRQVLTLHHPVLLQPVPVLDRLITRIRGQLRSAVSGNARE